MIYMGPSSSVLILPILLKLNPNLEYEIKLKKSYQKTNQLTFINPVLVSSFNPPQYGMRWSEMQPIFMHAQ